MAFMAGFAMAQSGQDNLDEIRDPEVQIPAQPAAQPCVMDAAAVQDPRISRDVLQVMQMNPYFSHTSRLRLARYVLVSNTTSSSNTTEYRYRRIGCGFYVMDETFAFKNPNGTVDRVKTTLMGPGGELFSEAKDTIRRLHGPSKPEIKTEWSQLTELQVFGNRAPVAIGNRYGIHKKTKKKLYDGSNEELDEALDCQVTERRNASEYHPQLTGNAFVAMCKLESRSARDDKRAVSTFNSIAFPDMFPDSEFSFDNPEKCHLELRSATEFNRNLHGNAFVARCTGSPSFVYLPELGQWLNVDVVEDLGTSAARSLAKSESGAKLPRKDSRSPPESRARERKKPAGQIESAGLKEKHLLTEVELAQ